MGAQSIAPPAVALVAYARPDHAARVLEALRANGAPLLYAFCDGPRGPADEPAVARVRKLVRSVDWTEVRVIERERNIGLAQSILGAVDHVLAVHDSLVLLEDDCVPGPHFMDFMRAALARYADAESVASVSGFAAPVRVPADYPFDAYLAPRISSFGWGTWRRAWTRALRRDLPAAIEEARARGVNLAAGGRDFIDLIEARADPAAPLDIWTPLWGIGTLIEGMRTLWPTRTFIRNIGFDGTGFNSPGAARVAARFDSPYSDQASGFRFPPPEAPDGPLAARLAEFFNRQARPRTFGQRMARRVNDLVERVRAPRGA